MGYKQDKCRKRQEKILYPRIGLFQVVSKTIITFFEKNKINNRQS